MRCFRGCWQNGRIHPIEYMQIMRLQPRIHGYMHTSHSDSKPTLINIAQGNDALTNALSIVDRAAHPADGMVDVHVSAWLSKRVSLGAQMPTAMAF